jgi:hypothetical protein
LNNPALAAYRSRLEAAARGLADKHRLRRRRRLTSVAVVAAILLVAATALGATGVLGAWLGGTPSPAEVKSDFAGIRPELGYSPEAEAAAEVARENDIAVHATPTREGGFCLVAEVPWLGFDGDGRGYCVKPKDAKRPFVAGVIGNAGDRDSGQNVTVVAGRTRVQGAAVVRLTDPNGKPVERPVGTGGFFVAVVRTGDIQRCFDGEGWTPTLIVFDAQRRELGRAQFPFWVPARTSSGKRTHACGLMSPMSDEFAARVIREERLR